MTEKGKQPEPDEERHLSWTESEPYKTGLEKIRSQGLQYEKSDIFRKRLLEVRAKLLRSRPEGRMEILSFVEWFDPYSHHLQDVEERLAKIAPGLRSDLEDYVKFVYRFFIRLRVVKEKGQPSTIVPIYPVRRRNLLIGRQTGHRILPLDDGGSSAGDAHSIEKVGTGDENPMRPDDQEDDSNLSLRSHLSDDDELMDWLESQGDETPRYLAEASADGFRSLVVELDGHHSLFTEVIDKFYDPFSINFLTLKRPIVNGRHQEYLLCLVGELAEGWRSGGRVLTKRLRHLYDESKAGAPSTNLNTRQLAAIALLEENGHIENAARRLLRIEGHDPDGVDNAIYRQKVEVIRRAKRDLAKQKDPS
jgi:hypothetical protein